MRLLTAALLLLASLVLADVGLQNAGVAIGPVRDLDCTRDAGILCLRDAGTSVGRLSCASASASNAGCITPSAQTMAGAKTWTGRQRIVGVAHGSLTACSSGEKGTWQTCTTHNAPVFCNGTSNIEMLGSSSAEEPLESIHVNGIPVFFFGGFTVGSTSAWTITAVTGFWGLGTGSGNIDLAFISTAGTCTCSVDCDAPGARTACTGNCTVPASDSVFGFRAASACTLDPYVGGNLTVMGTK